MTARSRRRFVKAATSAVGAIVTTVSHGEAQSSPRIEGFDHVALPMKDVDKTTAFYRALGLRVTNNRAGISVYIGSQMINFHRPERWQDPAFTLRAPAARPPCGDLCFVWSGTQAALNELLARAGVAVELGPVDRDGGRGRTGSSTYARDPDGNLLEFIIYP